MLTFSMSLRRTPHFDPKWMHLRATTVTMATMLGAYGCALLIEQKAGPHVDSIVQCVMIASALGRIQRVHSASWQGSSVSRRPHPRRIRPCPPLGSRSA